MTGSTGPNPDDVARQLREAADRLTAAWTSAAGSMASVAGATGQPSGTRPPAFPVIMSAEQLRGVLEEVGKRRAQVQALRDSLTVFDEQLEALEIGLRPMLEWTRGWAEMEKSITALWPPSSG